MPVKRTSHAVYDTKYHLVWAPKYRKWIVREDIRQRVEQLFRQIAEDFGFELEELEVAKDHVHIFLNFPPRYAIAKGGGILKSISASRVFKEYPELEEQLWKGEFLGGRVFCAHGGRCCDGFGDQKIYSLPSA